MPKHFRPKTLEVKSYSKNHDFDLVICYDSTGSMSDFIGHIKISSVAIMEDVMRRIPNIRISIFVHKDYDNEDEIYVYDFVDFTADKEKIRNFINGTGPSGGGGAECYELALRKVRTELSWREDSQRALIIIGDQCPHEPAEFSEIRRYYHKLNEALDWRLEVDRLIEQNCFIYPLKYGANAEADYFWSGLALKSKTYKAQLSEIPQFQQVLMAAICKAKGKDVYEDYKAEVKQQYAGRTMPANLKETLDTYEQMAGSLKAARADSSVTFEEDDDYEILSRRMIKNVAEVGIGNNALERQPVNRNEIEEGVAAGAAVGAVAFGAVGALAGPAGAVVLGGVGMVVGAAVGQVGGAIVYFFRRL